MSLKRKMTMAVATTTIGALIMGVGSFAFFTASSSNENNTFTAGTVAVDATQNGNAVFTASWGKLAPGDSGQNTITVKNTGNLGEWVRISKVTTSGDLFDNTTNSKASVNGQLVTANAKPLVLTPNADLQNGYTGYYVAPNGGTATIAINYRLPKEANNFYQGQTGTAAFTVQAVQAKNNTSSATDQNHPETGTGPDSWGDNSTVASQVAYYTSYKDGKTFMVSPKLINDNYVAQTTASDGTVQINTKRNELLTYFDSGIVINAGTIDNLKGINVAGTGNLGLNLWIDKDGDGKYFSINADGTYNGKGGDTYVSLQGISGGNITVDQNSTFSSLTGDFSGNKKLTDLAALYPNAHIAMWIGVTGNGTPMSATINSVSISNFSD